MDEWKESAIRWTARVVVILFFAAWTAAIRKPTTSRLKRHGSNSWFRGLWTAGAVSLLIHDLVAIAFAHGWSHAQAILHTADRTEELLGIRVGWGIYWNYAMTMAWIADAGWLWIAPASYDRRPPIIGGFLFGFFAFMVLQATIVFEHGLVRWIGVAGFAIVAMAAVRRRIRGTTENDGAPASTNS